MLELLPQPALLIDLENESVALANTRSSELSGYVLSNLIGAHLSQLFPTIEGKENFLDIELERLSLPFTTHLQTSYRLALPIEAKLTLLNPGGNLAILTFDAIEAVNDLRRRQSADVETLTYIQELAEGLQEPDLLSALSKTCGAALAILDTQVMAVYHLQGTRPLLRKAISVGVDGWLPSHLPADYLNQAKEVKVWRKGINTLTGLPQKAVLAGMEYMLIIPLGYHKAWYGLAVTASSQPPPGNIHSTIPVVQTCISSALQVHTLLESQRGALVDLRRNEVQVNLIKNMLQESIIILDTNLRIVDLNTAAEQALGYKLEEVKGQQLSRILIGSSLKLDTPEPAEQVDKDKPDGDQTSDGTQPALPPEKSQSKDLGKVFTERLFRRSGNSFLANYRLIQLKEKSSVAGYALVLQDLSELEEYRKRNDQLERQAVFGEMTASFVHDIKNPINSLKTGLQLLAEIIPSESPYQSNIRRLQVNCDNIAEVLNSGLSFIRTNEYKMRPLHLEKLLARLIKTVWQQRMYIHQVKCDFRCEAQETVIEGDEKALEHMFTNLFDNAVDAMSANDQETQRLLSITIREHKVINQLDQLVVLFSDTGPGISESARDKIFNLGYTTKKEGSGIGLAIVKNIATAHKGVAQVESIVGGTIISIMIPSFARNGNEFEILM